MLSERGPKQFARRFVLSVLGMYADPDGTNCFPSTRLLAQRTGMGRKYVEQHLEEAEREGWIQRERRRGSGQGWRQIYYTLTLPNVESESVHERGVIERPPSPDERGVPPSERGVFASKRGVSATQKVESQGIHTRPVTTPDTTPSTTGAREDEETGNGWAAAKAIIREKWHLGSDDIQTPAGRVGMGLEYVLFGELLKGFSSDEIIGAISVAPDVFDWDASTPHSLRWFTSDTVGPANVEVALGAWRKRKEAGAAYHRGGGFQRATTMGVR